MAHLSDSKAQMIAERLILEKLEPHLGIPCGSLQTKRIMLDNVVSVDCQIISANFCKIKLIPSVPI